MAKKEAEGVFSEFELSLIDHYLQEAESYRTAAAVGQALANVSLQIGKIDLRQIEQRLRKRGGGIYFVALPVSKLEDHIAVWPHAKEKYYPYYLYICMNGEKEFIQRLNENGITPDENFARLADTGLLALKPGSTTARQSKSHFN